MIRTVTHVHTLVLVITDGGTVLSGGGKSAADSKNESGGLATPAPCPTAQKPWEVARSSGVNMGDTATIKARRASFNIPIDTAAG
jgi:hypothetical protein